MVYSTNKRRPRTDFWRTPQVSVTVLDVDWLKTSFWPLSPYNNEFHWHHLWLWSTTCYLIDPCSRTHSISSSQKVLSLLRLKLFHHYSRIICWQRQWNPSEMYSTWILLLYGSWPKRIWKMLDIAAFRHDLLCLMSLQKPVVCWDSFFDTWQLSSNASQQTRSIQMKDCICALRCHGTATTHLVMTATRWLEKTYRHTQTEKSFCY